MLIMTEKPLHHIIELTNGQPYLVQLICRELITRYNRQTFEEGKARERRFQIADVEAIINTPEFYLEGSAYFQGIWEQAENSEPTGQLEILQVLSRAALSAEELVSATHLSIEEVTGAIKTLEKHDVIFLEAQRYSYTVKLMQNWVKREKVRE